MKDTKKAKFLYGILFFIILLFISRYVLNVIDKYQNNIDEVDNIKIKVEDIKHKVEDYQAAISEYQATISEYQGKINTLENQASFHKNRYKSYKITTTVPYKFIEYSEFKNNITDYEYINFNNHTIIRTSVEIQGVNNVIAFLSHVSRKYKMYYLSSFY